MKIESSSYLRMVNTGNSERNNINLIQKANTKVIFSISEIKITPIFLKVVSKRLKVWINPLFQFFKKSTPDLLNNLYEYLSIIN